MSAPVAVSVGTTATLILAANTARISYFIINNHSAAIFVAEDNTVTTVNGLPLGSGGALSEDQGERLFKGDIFGIVATATADVRVWERTSTI